MWPQVLLCVCVLLVQAQGTSLYGIYVRDAYGGAEHIVSTVSVSATGNFTVLSENSIIVGDSFINDGISAIDGNKSTIYYSLNNEVTIVDVSSGALLPSVNIGAVSIATLVRDTSGEQLLVTGVFADNSTAIYAIPDDGPAQELVNLTKAGANIVVTAALNETSGTYFLIHFTTSQTFELASFTLKTPKTLKSAPFPCGTQWQPFFLAVDSQNLVGIAGNARGSGYDFFKIADGKCTTKKLNLPGVITCATYSQTSSTIFLSYSPPNGGAQLCTYSLAKSALNCITAFDVLADIEAY